MLSKQEKDEIQAYIKRLTKEGTSTGAIATFATPAAFNPDEEADGSELGTEAGTPYLIVPETEKRNFVKLHEQSYGDFKLDESGTQYQKVNRRILEINRSLREISRALDHSIKLRNEAVGDDTPYWSRTNEAILKIHRRLSEVVTKAGQLANIKELANSQLQKTLVKLFTKAGFEVHAEDVECVDKGKGVFECDVLINGEPVSIDVRNGVAFLQDYESEVELGKLDSPQAQEAIVTKLNKLLKP